MRNPGKYISHSKPTLTNKDHKAVGKVIRSKMIARGAKVAEFEQKVAQYLGLKGGIATSSGTSALCLALRALGINSNDEVIFPTYVCPTLLYAVESNQATPVLCDINDYWRMDCDSVKPHLTAKTRAIIAPHIGGIPVDINPIVDLGIPVIEDIAQAFGAEINGEKAGTFGQVTICSFQAQKCLTTGEGGMILSNDAEFLDRARELQILSPMSDIQASLGISQLEQYPLFLERRHRMARYFFRVFGKFAHICMPGELRRNSMFFRFPLRVRTPFNILKDEFEERGIAVRQFIDMLIHRMLELPVEDFPNAEKCFEDTLSIPIYPSLNGHQIQYVAKVCEQIFSKLDTVET